VPLLFLDGVSESWKSDAETKLAQLEGNSQDWKGRIIWEELYEQLDQAIEQILSHCLIFEIPVPMTALEVVCKPLVDYKNQLSRAIELGLIEVSPEMEESNRVYRVSRILPRIIPSIQISEGTEIYSLYQNAHEKLHSLWGNQENRSEEKWREIFRLLFANKENLSRFRQGFYQMLAFLNHIEADRAFESELRKVKEDLPEDGLCTLLEKYLNLGNWKVADKETTWIFYQIMVKENYRSWNDLLENFPCETLKEINQFWLENSNGKFGISIQMETYQSLGGSFSSDLFADLKEKPTPWDKFCEHIGWQERETERILEYHEVVNQEITIADAPLDGSEAKARLPILIYTRNFQVGGSRGEGGWGGWGKNVTSYGDLRKGGFIEYELAQMGTALNLFSRAKRCNLQGDISSKILSEKSPLLLGLPVATSKKISDQESDNIKDRIVAERGTEPILYTGDSHLITIAPTGAGKGRSVIIPNLLTYKGPIVVFDPKGENYAVTARTRKEMGQQVIRLDPFGVIDKDSDCFNPLDIFNLSNADVETDAQMLAELLSQGNKWTRDPFWDLTACGLISGLIAYTVTSKPDNERHLDTVRQLLMAEEMDYTIAVKLDTEGEKMNRMAFDELASFSNMPRENTRPSVLAVAQSYIKA
jgi:hypothetical protein